MAGGEDEAQQIIIDILVEHGLDLGHLLFEGHEIDGQRTMLAIDHGGAPEAIERPVPRDLGQPGGRVARNAILGPALQCQQEGILGDLLGQTDVTQIAGKPGGELRLLDAPNRFDGTIGRQPFSSLKG